MTRGNQREKAREKNLKKQQDLKKGGKESGVSLTERRHRDAEIMRQKQRRKPRRLALVEALVETPAPPVARLPSDRMEVGAKGRAALREAEGGAAAQCLLLT
ncbi:hypothetical protein EGW08_004040 [Elysia chlorotica]|uniref:Small EDRK-rich factor-like N-terminal domain-containing protein n=1 Tax=Elysia chlorotica TaxID=188477 RepID=A0A433U378_ELYCH|nr:hypothetical protein EGW08_004040 [Elysia chlorotica]